MDAAYIKNAFHFSPDEQIPMYKQFASFISLQVKAGVLKPGDRMVSRK